MSGNIYGGGVGVAELPGGGDRGATTAEPHHPSPGGVHRLYTI